MLLCSRTVPLVRAKLTRIVGAIARMTGSGEKSGIIPRTLNDLFVSLNKSKQFKDIISIGLSESFS
jgi:hypothetical protein